MKIYVIGGKNTKFLDFGEERQKFLVDEKHEGKNIDFLNPWYCELTGLYHLNIIEDILSMKKQISH